MSQTLILPEKKQVSIRDYLRLRKQVQQTLLQGRKRAETLVEHERVRTYWKVGWLIDRHILKYKGRADYGKQVIERLAHDLGMSRTELYYVLEFARTYPIVPPVGQFSWKHYRSLLSIDEKAKREALETQAIQEGWSSHTLEQKVSALRQIRKASPFVPKRGTLHTYRIVAFKDKPLSLDLGFTSYIELDPKGRKGLKDGDLVRSSSLSKLKKVSSEEKTNLYTYRASLERVVDGDTLWMKIDLGFGIFIREKLRLRGLDAPEIETTEGKEAKAFLESSLRGVPSARKQTDPSGRRSNLRSEIALLTSFARNDRGPQILITTTKPDKYDRYLSDIWIPKSVSPIRQSTVVEKDPNPLINLNQLLLDHGLARLKTAVRPQDWGE